MARFPLMADSPQRAKGKSESRNGRHYELSDFNLLLDFAVDNMATFQMEDPRSAQRYTILDGGTVMVPDYREYAGR